jgi:hypothetical protein
LVTANLYSIDYLSTFKHINWIQKVNQAIWFIAQVIPLKCILVEEFPCSLSNLNSVNMDFTA